MAKQIGNPELLDTWASDGDVSEPFLSKKEQGWLFQEQPASALMNWVQNEQQQKINHLLKNGVSEWSTNTAYTRGAIVKHANTAWKALRDNTASEPAAGNLDWKEVSTLPILRAPDLISPIDGASGIATTVTLTASEYAPVYSVDDRDYREFEVDEAGGDFSSPVRTEQVNADTWAVDPALDASAGYVWRCRDVSLRGDVSEWSVIEPFTTGANFITTPSITAPANGATGIAETPTFTSSAFAVTGTTDTHVASYWRVRLAGVTVWETGRTTTQLVSATISTGILVDGETTYTVEVRHEGAALGLSAWSTASSFTTLDTFTRVAKPSITSPLAGETNIPETPTFTSSAFAVINGSDTHAASFWEVYTPADALVWSSGRTTINRTSITMPAGILADGETSYKVRVRHEGATLGVSEWSDTVTFVTEESFLALFSAQSSNRVAKIRPQTMSLSSSFSGHSAIVGPVAFGSDGFLYSGSFDNTIRKISPSTMSQAGIFTAGNDVLCLAFGTDGFLYSAENGAIRKINPATMAQSGSSLTYASTTPFALVWGGDNLLYVAGSNSKVLKVNPSTMTVIDDGDTYNFWVRAAAFGSDDYLYASDSGTLYRIEPSTLSSVLSASFSSITGLAFGSDGFLYASRQGPSNTGEVLKINPSTLTVSGSPISYPVIASCVCFGEDGFLYASKNDGFVVKINPSDMTQVASFNSGAAPSNSLGGGITSICFNISIPDLLGFTA